MSSRCLQPGEWPDQRSPVGDNACAYKAEAPKPICTLQQRYPQPAMPIQDLLQRNNALRSSGVLAGTRYRQSLDQFQDQDFGGKRGVMVDAAGYNTEEASSDKEVIVEAAMEAAGLLRSGALSCRRSEGVYEYLFCVFKKKKSYHFHQLLDHAHGEGSSTGRRPNSQGQHRALAKYMETELKEEAAQMLHRLSTFEQIVSPRLDGVNLLVFPWVGVVANISAISTEGKGMTPGKGELKRRFSQYNLEKVKVSGTMKGHWESLHLCSVDPWMGMMIAGRLKEAF